MGGLSPIHWLIILAVLLVVFARPGKLSGFMGDAAKAIGYYERILELDEVCLRALAAEDIPTATVDDTPAASR